MIRSLAVGGVLLLLGLTACGRLGTAAASNGNGAAIGTYLLDASADPSASPAPAGAGAPAGQTGTAGQAGAAPGTATPASGAAGQNLCGSGQKAYRALVFLVSSDTGKSVPTIVAALRTGESLDQIAGSDGPQVRAQAMAAVQAWVQFAEANGKLTDQQALQVRQVAAAAIAAMMEANVSSCVPAAG